MRVVLISIGTELTTGGVLDTNSNWLGRQLFETGVPICQTITVPDDLAGMKSVLKTASSEADLVIVTGGLGPTADDLTRCALAAAGGVQLLEDPTCRAQIEEFFASRGRKLNPSNLLQAMIPQGGAGLANTQGTAPGISMKIGNCQLFALPGVPREMRWMFNQYVLAWLDEHCSNRGLCVIRKLHCIGAGESDIGQRIGDLMLSGGAVNVGTSAQEGLITIHIRASGADQQQAQAAIDDCEGKIRSRLGNLIFGVDDQTMADVLGRLLVDRGATIALAESCTAGLLAKLITDAAGSSRYFLAGYICYSNQAKQEILGVEAQMLAKYGAVSEQAARAMAQAARKLAGADLAVSITGIAGPGGGTETKPVGLVYIAIADKQDCWVRECRFGSVSRQAVRNRSALVALNMIRMYLLGDL